MKFIGLALFAIGCGGGEAPPPEVDDVRVPIPAADSRFFDIVTPEVTIESGGDKAFCYWLDVDFASDMSVQNLITLQGRGGHHLVVLSTTKPKPSGTLEDCTDRASMKDFRPLVIPVELPEGGGIYFGMGRQVVLQFHYINARDKPILVRDVARLQLVESSAVTEWFSTFSTNDALFDIPAGGTDHVAVDCGSLEDVSLYLVGGHMHEWGSKFELLAGPDVDHLEQLYFVDPWQADYRDNPPVTLFRENPFPLARGTVIRTVCDWTNDTDESLKFPQEMCAGFGYVRGTKNGWVCDSGGVLENQGGFIARHTN